MTSKVAGNLTETYISLNINRQTAMWAQTPADGDYIEIPKINSIKSEYL